MTDLRSTPHVPNNDRKDCGLALAGRVCSWILRQSKARATGHVLPSPIEKWTERRCCGSLRSRLTQTIWC